MKLTGLAIRVAGSVVVDAQCREARGGQMFCQKYL